MSEIRSKRFPDKGNIFPKKRTPVAEAGGTDPEWDDGINDVWENRLLLPPDPSASCLLLEIWTEETVEDQLVGQVEINFFEESLRLGQMQTDRVQYKLDTGGYNLYYICFVLLRVDFFGADGLSVRYTSPNSSQKTT